MEICLVTPHAVRNYGAMLQAYALGHFIGSLGYPVTYYDFPPHRKKTAHTLKEFLAAKAFVLLKWCYRSKLAEQKDKFREFSSHFELTTDKDAPCFVVGSDQVWHPNNLDDIFSLAFASPRSMKFSYAASFGVDHIPASCETRFQQAFGRLSYLSARESDGAKEVSRITGRECAVHVDPTFLLSKETWEGAERPIPEIEGPYTVLFLLYVPKDINRLVQRLRNRFARKIYIIDLNCYLHLGIHGTSPLINVGPREFLWLIHHAELVVTSSFHGMAFSLIFERQFLPLVNPAFSSRMVNLLRMVNLDYDFRNPLAFLDRPIDYSAGKPLENEIAKSKEYLVGTLKNISKEAGGAAQ